MSFPHYIPNEPVVMGQPVMAPGTTMGGQPVIWPNGVGITDRPQANENECSCGAGSASAGCCGQPIWYVDRNRRPLSGAERWGLTGTCCEAFEVRDATIDGQQYSFRGEHPFCSSTQFVHVSQGTRPIGRVVLYHNTFSTSGPVKMAEAFDSAGTSLFIREEDPCHPTSYLTYGGCCDFSEWNWPLLYTPNKQPLTNITYRYHACAGCYPSWIGIREFPAAAPPDHRALMLGMVHGRRWRLKQDQNRRQNSHNY